MKYKITIVKIEPKMVKERNWVQVDPYKNDEGETKTHDYRIEEKQREDSEEIYEQVIEKDIDLMAVIEAFNKPVSNTKI